MMRRRSFADGDVIFREGESSDGAYLVVSGVVDIVTGYGTPRQKVIAVLSKGQYFGEMGAVDDHPRSATAVAHGDADCMFVGHEEFMKTLLEDPKEAIDLLKILFERLREANRRMA